MAKERKRAASRDDSPKSRKLREIAQEASERLDTVLADGDGAPAAPAGRSGRRPSTNQAGPSLAKEKVAVPAGNGRAGADKPDPPAAGKDEADVSRMTSDQRVKRALVCHVSFGVARIIANLLEDMGLAPHVVSTLEELENQSGSDDWDIVFLQGTGSPYPAVELVEGTIERCVGAETPVVLLKWPGRALVRAVENVNVSGALEWPFEQSKVRKELSSLVS